MKYCSNCGTLVRLGIPPDDNKERYICDACDTIHYQNPNIITGCLPRWENKILMCRRSIVPRMGYWTTPAGFMENGESVEEGALRETMEEANAEVEIVRLFSVSSIPHINQVYMIYLANLKNLNFFPGPESAEVQLCSEEEIDWDNIAFSAIDYALRNFFKYPDDNQIHCNSISSKRR
ncbi:MAG: NUDIX hydrolase [SAR324 cluster bacterium]|nr:NUDIX hydrolase [SAR324 cluster bacterium]